MTERQPKRRLPQIDHCVLVYRHRKSGRIYAAYAAERMAIAKEYEHIASVDPALWIMAHWDEVTT